MDKEKKKKNSSPSRSIFSFPGKESAAFSLPAGKAFTLIELVVVLAIIVISLGFAVASFRGDSAARQLERASTGFETFCARARFQAQEHGEDIIVCFSPVTKEFITKRSLTEEELAAEERKRQELTDDDEPMPDPPSVIKWKLPENTEINEDSFAAEDAPDDNMYEVFRFFPDGGASGIRRFKLQCKALSLTYDISPLPGLLTTVKEEE